jgi:hypothetical protein
MTPAGIRTTVEFTDPELCPLVEFSAREGATVQGVRRTRTPTPDGGATVEFSADVAVDPEGPVTRLFSHGPVNRYRLSTDEPPTCPCSCLGSFGCPVTGYEAREGTLRLVFYAADYEQLRAVVAALRERFPDVDIVRFVRSPGDGDPDGTDSVLVDRGRLTPRQREVLETAFEMGYFERPRRANATEVAETLGIGPSTFREHLAAAETKLLEDILGGGR